MRVFLQVVSCLILYAESFAQFFSSSSGSHSPSVFIPWHMADGELSKSISGYFTFGDWKAALYCNNWEEHRHRSINVARRPGKLRVSSMNGIVFVFSVHGSHVLTELSSLQDDKSVHRWFTLACE
ncbi:hypothetical protein SCHPADRAFT_166121 [Schizopora paradoxa]|uniref:Uncharacterized protein n=1 Tax=Schizopora paradoxa TaxID=27342 RepID=A0A0H2SJR9_9AGAM|nr:hypothetical protein SCHPADRAFT_166121 [Schizopora paradoxa]